MSDAGGKITNRMLSDLEQRLAMEYTQAETEIRKKTTAYFENYEKQYRKWEKAVSDGSKTEKEFRAWQMQTMAQGKRWNALKDQISADLYNVDKIARSITDGYMAGVYAVNHNYGLYQIEHGAEIDTSLTLYDRQTVERLIRNDPDLLPPPGKKVSDAITRGELRRWNRQTLQSVMTQGILQGESIPKLATRLANTVGERNHNAAVRNARTMATNAQNAGRYDAYRRVSKEGVDLTIEWQASLDNRTRHEHRQLHGQRRNIDEPFEVDGIEILYPAQLKGASSDIPQSMIWNCRCTLLAWVKGFEGETVTKSDKMGDMSFEEWQNAKAPKEAEQVVESVKTLKTVGEYQKSSAKTLQAAYEYHRTANETRAVASSALPDGFFSVDYGKMSAETAQAFDSTLGDLASRFDTPLTKVRLMDKTEFAAKSNAFAFVRHSYETDVAELVINPAKCGDYDSLTSRIKELTEKRYSANIPEESYGRYIATHEFAHTLFNTGDQLNDKRNFVGANYTAIRSARKEMQTVYDDYLTALEPLDKKKRDLEFRVIMGEDVGGEAREALSAYNSMKISTYSLESADEFLAESFAAVELGHSTNEFANAAYSILQKYFGR